MVSNDSDIVDPAYDSTQIVPLGWSASALSGSDPLQPSLHEQIHRPWIALRFDPG
jgi:hypothetical protein